MNANSREAIRQERETFDHLRRQDHQWFLLRLSMGWTAVVILIAVIALATRILIMPQPYPRSVVAAAGGALFVEVAGVILGVWKIVITPATSERLKPVTARDRETSERRAA